ncbi:nucleotide exchange factor GrpE [Candidatus Pinguicoccus supinus]|uniref:Nucleotide exchange factor GrpE n=1 Tax=Candidatus Pinguicoccus supinus TaxID=2529394 RepID=A0A7T0FYE3_9BACT|nr:nucleotide exchange factor GrpE [Candidatus Pinguicoccus supinus]
MSLRIVKTIELIDLYKNIKLKFISIKKSSSKLDVLYRQAVSDFSAYKIRSERLLNEESQNIMVSCIKDFLMILDCLEMGLKNVKDSLYIQGFKLIIQQFYKILKNKNIIILNPVGELFNPLRHEVIKSTNNTSIISQVVRKGFLFKKNKNILIRPAYVVL